MIYVKVGNDMSLAVTVNGTLYRGDNLAQKITYLIPNYLNEINISKSNIYLCYVRADGVADIVLLDRNEKMYNDTYYQFTVPVDCRMTKYPGEVCTWLTFYADVVSGSEKPQVAKTGECFFRILESKSMDAYLEDGKLSAIYQMHKMIQDNDPSKINTIDAGALGDKDDFEDLKDKTGEFIFDGGTAGGN